MDIDILRVVEAFVISLIAGLSTGLGGCLALFIKEPSQKFLAVMLGFSAGVMLYISMVEILSEARKLLSAIFIPKISDLYVLIGFFSGMVIIKLINKLIPSNINVKLSNDDKDKNKKLKLFRLGLFTSIVIAIHNFPEGIASFVSSLHSLRHAIPIVLAIALHNLPEGISVSVPIYYATKSKEKAFRYSLLSGMAEPLGALIGFLLLLPFLNNIVFGILYAVIAGIMAFISLDELIPTATEYGGHQLTITGVVSGMLFMAISLWLFV